uniref:Uncharacterized protein n=1 Tax=Arundo donax TaxID=35708 RepID=A0A0A9CWI5_ARUDO
MHGCWIWPYCRGLSLLCPCISLFCYSFLLPSHSSLLLFLQQHFIPIIPLLLIVPLLSSIWLASASAAVVGVKQSLWQYVVVGIGGIFIGLGLAR